MSEINLKDYEPLINKMARNCFKKLPPRAKILYQIEDLVQEGRLAFLKTIKGNKFDKERGTQFITYFFRVLQSCFSNILHNPEIFKNFDDLLDEISNEILSDVLINHINPEREYQIQQALAELEKISKNFLDLILSGAPDELLRFAKLRARVKSYELGHDVVAAKIKIYKKDYKKFYGWKGGKIISLNKFL